MKSSLIYLYTILLLTSCIQKTQKAGSKELFTCGPDNFPSILINSTLCEGTTKCRDLYFQFNDSLKTRTLPISFRQISCINERQRKVGIAYYESTHDYIEIDLTEFWILVNYDDDIGIHINASSFRDSLNKVLAIMDNNLSSLYEKVRQNPEADSLARPEILITLNVKTDSNKQLSKSDYDKLTEYMRVMTNLATMRMDELSIKMWGKSYTNIEMRQKIVVCNLLGYLFMVNIT
jgi:hypothetical protein